MQMASKRYHGLAPEQLGRGLSGYTQALRSGDADAAARVLDELPALSLGDIHSKIVAPALRAVGESWCTGGKNAIGQEHLATQIVLHQLEMLRATFASPPRGSSYRVLVSCLEGERHFVGARMFADLCLAQGWMVDFLGPDMPAPDLLATVGSRRPQILALSITMPEGIAPARRLLEELGQIGAPPRVILGGLAMAGVNPWNVTDVECTVAGDLIEGIAIAARFQREVRPKTILREYLIGLGRRVRALRGQKGWTQEQLAEAARVTRVCIVAVEGGKQNLSMDIVVRMANALGVTPEGLLTGQDTQFQA